MNKTVLLKGNWKGGNPRPEWLPEEACYELFNSEYAYQGLFPHNDTYHLAMWEKGLFMFGNSHVYVTVTKAEKMALALAKAWFRKTYC